jgi:hypothetical protein
MFIFLMASAYFSHVSGILMTGGAIVATVGACRIYYKWSAGQGNVEAEIFQWGAGIIFLLASSITVKALFGV